MMVTPWSSLRVEQDRSSFSSVVSSTPSVNDFNSKSPNKVKKTEKTESEDTIQKKKITISLLLPKVYLLKTKISVVSKFTC